MPQSSRRRAPRPLLGHLPSLLPRPKSYVVREEIGDYFTPSNFPLTPSNLSLPLAVLVLLGLCVLGYLVTEFVAAVAYVVNSLVTQTNELVALLVANPLALTAIVAGSIWIAVSTSSIGLLITSKYLKRRKLWPQNRAEWRQLIFSPRKAWGRRRA